MICPRWAVVAGLVVVATAALLVGVAAPPWLRAVVGLPATLVVPGMLAFVAAQRRLPGGLLDWTITVATSIGLLAGGGILLNLAPSGLGPVSWAVVLAATSATSGAVALVRLRSRPAAAGRAEAEARPRRVFRVRSVLTAGLALVVCGAALGAGAAVTLRSEHRWTSAQHLTELSLSTVGSTWWVHLDNREGVAMTYRVVTEVRGMPPISETVPVPTGGRWSRALPTVPASARSGQSPILMVTIYRPGDTDPYRSVRVNGGQT